LFDETQMIYPTDPPRFPRTSCEIIDVEEHPQGGHIVTRQKTKYHEATKTKKRVVLETSNEQYLRTGYLEWYTWPALETVTAAHGWKTTLENNWKERELRLKYQPTKSFKPKPRGNPNRCVYCHTDMSGVAAQCLKCGGALHLTCAQENNNRCITPGCETRNTGS